MIVFLKWWYDHGIHWKLGISKRQILYDTFWIVYSFWWYAFERISKFQAQQNMNVGAPMNLLRCRKHGSLYKPVVRLSLSYQSFNFLTSKSAINSEWSNTNTAAIRIYQVVTTGHSLCFPCGTIFQSCKEKWCLTTDLANHPCLSFNWYYWSLDGMTVPHISLGMHQLKKTRASDEVKAVVLTSVF